MSKMMDHVLEKNAGFLSNYLAGQASNFAASASETAGKVLHSGFTEGLMQNKERIDALSGAVKNVGAIAIPAIGIAAWGMSHLKNKLQNDMRRKHLIDDLLTNDPILKTEDKQKVMDFYLTIMSVAPSLSLDLNIVRELLQNFVKFGRIDINTIKTLSDIEKSRGDSSVNPFTKLF